MEWLDIARFAVFLGVLTILVKPVGGYLARVFRRDRTFLDPILLPVERLLHRLAGSDPDDEMEWSRYATAFIVFTAVGTVLLYVLLRVQRLLPWSRHVAAAIAPDLAMNTAISFSTTTTWQAYAGETAMSYLSQIAGLMLQNFVAGAAGLAAGIAFIRGIARQQSSTLGNFWGDLIRSLLWVLLPASLIVAVILLSSGVPMSFAPYVTAHGLDGGVQTITRGPVAAFESIKNLGTNGGGFFNANGAHPFESPTPFTNLLHMFAIAVIPAALTYTFGSLTGRRKQGWVFYAVMVVLFVAGLIACDLFERRGLPLPGAAQTVAAMEGKEVRFGIGDSVLTAITTSNGATGSYAAMVDSFTPLGGAVVLTNMLLGEIVFGGLGTGVISLLMILLLAVFLGGLMVGRTPELLGKHVGPRETKLIVLYTIAGPAAVLIPTAIAVVTRAGLAGLTTNDGAHGLTEILFAFASAFANNGQNMAGLNANSVFYNVATAAAMMAGRFLLIVPALALAGSFARQQNRPQTAGTIETDTPLFAVLLLAIALLTGALTYLPALCLGPVREQLAAGAPSPVHVTTAR
jgi:K+-transporting ATPase ATPase A chain